MDSISKSEIDKNWSNILKSYRLKANLTQEQLAEKVGISVKYISRIETAKSGIKTQTLIKYINTLGITPNAIYKTFIDNPDVQLSIKVSEQIDYLSNDKKEFLLSVIEELKKI